MKNTQRSTAIGHISRAITAPLVLSPEELERVVGGNGNPAGTPQEQVQFYSEQRAQALEARDNASLSFKSDMIDLHFGDAYKDAQHWADNEQQANLAAQNLNALYQARDDAAELGHQQDAAIDADLAAGINQSYPEPNMSNADGSTGYGEVVHV